MKTRKLPGKLLSLALALMLTVSMCLCGVVNAASDKTMTVSSASGQPGETVTVTVSTNGITSVKSLAAEINFDLDSFACVGSTIDSSLQAFVDEHPSTLARADYSEDSPKVTLYFLSSDAAFTNLKDFCTLDFFIKPGAAAGTISCTLNILRDENGTSVKDDVQVTNGTITVEEVPDVPVETITLDKSMLDMAVGDTEALTATITPDNATDKAVTWSSSDTEIASVDEDGVVTALKAGFVTITATTANGKSAACVVSVSDKDIPAEGIALDQDSLDLTVDDTETLTATVSPDNATDKAVTWSSSDPEIASVDENGVVTALKAGTATITATTANGKTAQCTVTVSDKVIPAENVTLDQSSLDLTVDDTETLTATVSPDNATDKAVTWSSSDPDVASVDENGVVTALKAGTATITATTANGKTAQCTVTVSDKVIPAENVTLDQSSLDLTVDDTETLTATVSPDNATDKAVTWSSSDPDVASVDENGVVTALKAGTATITATTANGKTAQCTVTVSDKVIPAENVTLDQSSLDLTVDDTETLTATVSPDNATDKAVTWSSSDPEIASVDENGVVTALKAGTATITATTANGKTAQCTVTVSDKVIPAENVTLDQSSLDLTVDDTETLTATVSPDNATDKAVTWSSSDPEIASVDENGVVTALKAGTATITATTANGKTAQCTVTVSDKAVDIPTDGVTLDQDSLDLNIGDTETLTATVSPDNATDQTVTWTSSAPEVATVDENGKITALKEGTTVITVTTSDGFTAECTVTVKGGQLNVDSVTFEKDQVTLEEGESDTLKVVILPEGATGSDIVWESSDPSIVSVDENGKITALKPGKVTITVTIDGVKATCEVEVTAKDGGSSSDGNPSQGGSSSSGSQGGGNSTQTGDSTTLLVSSLCAAALAAGGVLFFRKRRNH